MSKALKITALAIFILLIGGFDLLRLSAQGPETNYFNTNLRYQFARYPLTRQILGLRDFGDDRADYLGNSKTVITLEVYKMSGLQLDQDVLNKLAADVKSVTNKSVKVELHADLPYAADVSDSDIASDFKNYVLPGQDPKSAYVYLLVLSEQTGQPDQLGSTYNADTILLFNTALSDFTADVPDTFDNYQLSTALHEFGHQIGLDHNSQPDCLMNAKAEVSGIPQSSPEDVLTYFCPFELNQIKNLRY